MADSIEEIFNGLAAPFYFGQILVTKRDVSGFVLLHRDDAPLDRLQTYLDAGCPAETKPRSMDER